MTHYACIDEHCRCLIYLGNDSRKQCPVCNGNGRPIAPMMIDDLIAALDREYVPPTDQMKLAFDGPSASTLAQRVREAQ
jgi:hypothetical protein